MIKKTEERKLFHSTFLATRLEQVILQTNHEGHLAFKACKLWSLKFCSVRQTHACYIYANAITHTSRQMCKLSSFLYKPMNLYPPFHLMVRIWFMKMAPTSAFIINCLCSVHLFTSIPCWSTTLLHVSTIRHTKAFYWSSGENSITCFPLAFIPECAFSVNTG